MTVQWKGYYNKSTTPTQKSICKRMFVIIDQTSYEALGKYEDAEEQGLLLPTEAYFIKNNNVCKGWVQELVYSPCRKLLLDIRYDDNTLDSYRGYLGNTVFFTQAEAEQKLNEMECD